MFKLTLSYNVRMQGRHTQCKQLNKTLHIKKPPKPGRTVSIYTTVKGRSFEADVISKKNSFPYRHLLYLHIFYRH